MGNQVKRYAVAAIVALGFSLAPGALRTSQEAQEKIATWEDCRAFPYRDIAGVKTVGCGSTGNIPDRHHTKQEVAGRWVNDLRRAENCINQNFNGRDMPQRHFEAMTDAAFNLGCRGLMWFKGRDGRMHRTTIWRLAQGKNWNAMCGRLTDFVNSGGRYSQGLFNRRNDFRNWCMNGVKQ
ncbi:lysozyme [Escherichia coli]|nr:lysozyme [Escherichia coli]EJO7656083.1 lysozyme [Escherichia coli]